MQLDLKLELPDKQRESKKKIELMCKNCDHNALDDFYNRLNNGEEEVKK